MLQSNGRYRKYEDRSGGTNFSGKREVKIHFFHSALSGNICFYVFVFICRPRVVELSEAFLKRRRRINLGIVLGGEMPANYRSKVVWAVDNMQPPQSVPKSFPPFDDKLMKWVQDGNHLSQLIQSTGLNKEKVLAVDLEFHNRFSYDGKGDKVLPKINVLICLPDAPPGDFFRIHCGGHSLLSYIDVGDRRYARPRRARVHSWKSNEATHGNNSGHKSHMWMPE